MGTKLVEIDGRQATPRPSFAKGLTDGDFANYLSNADSIKRGYMFANSYSFGSKVYPMDRGTLGKFVEDTHFDAYVEDMVRLGNPRITPEFAGMLANRMAKQGDILELICTGADGKSDKPFPKIGSGLSEGSIVFRGDVKEATGVRENGMLYIDGNVDTVACGGGITYINGDVKHVKNVDQGIVIIAGKLGDCTFERRSGGGLNLEVSHSPFVFATNNPSEITISGGGRRDFDAAHTPVIEPEPVHVVDPERVQGWLPEEVREKAMALCTERLKEHFEFVTRVVSSIKTPTEMAKYARANLYGYVEGLSHGTYNAGNSIDAD